MSEQKSYTIKYHARSRRITISIHGDGGIVVTAPRRVSKVTIDAFVVEKKAWIESTQQKQREKRKQIVPHTTVRQPSYEACKFRAKKLLISRVEEVNKYYHFDYARISVKDLKSRWGSCSTKRNLNFHYKLLFLPLELVDYVVVHELCHLKEMNHSEKFWKLVGMVVPDYKKKRQEINTYLL